MPIVQQQYPKPSTLADVIQQVIDAFDAMGDGRHSVIMVGKKYLQEGVGSAPRIIFVPETDGRVGPPVEMGDAASIQHGCMVLFRMPEKGSDIDRFNEAYALGDRIISCLAVAGSGRLEWGSHGDGSPVDVDAYGAELVIEFTYRRALRHDAARWALPAADANTAPAEPLVPPGTPADVAAVNVTVTPEES